MIIENPQKIKKADIVVGIPSFNEEANIALVAELAAKGLKEYFPDKVGVVINADNYSADGTKEVFLGASAAAPLIYVSTQPSFKGKGYNLYNLFLMMQQMEAKTGIVLDADLKSLTPQWIKKMTDPINAGYDFIAPYYVRMENEATITNHLVYPLVYGLFGWNLRQPIGGDFAFSDKMADWWLEQKWSDAAFTFGIDIFMSLNAYLAGAKCGQVNLGKKIHRITSPNGLDKMFGQVAESLFKIILDNVHKIKERTAVLDVEVIGETILPALSDLQPDYKPYQDRFFAKFKEGEKSFKNIVSAEVYKILKDYQATNKYLIEDNLWAKILYDFMIAYQACGRDMAIIESLKTFYFGRVASYFEQTKSHTPAQSEKELVAQAQAFFDLRQYFLDRQKNN